MKYTCNKCKELKPKDQFHRDCSVSRGISYLCKACRNELSRLRRTHNPEKCRAEQRTWRAKNKDRIPMIKRRSDLKGKYGLTLEEYESMVDKQGGVCYVCKQPEKSCVKSGTLMSLAVDHDHSCCPGEKSCGKCIRGLLCSKCNRGLGYFDDNLELIRSLVEYLDRFSV